LAVDISIGSVEKDLMCLVKDGYLLLNLFFDPEDGSCFYITPINVYETKLLQIHPVGCYSS
jgi:hypothetical protein